MDDKKFCEVQRVRGNMLTFEKLLDECTMSPSSLPDWQEMFPEAMIQRHRAEMLDWARKRYEELKVQYAAL